MAPPKRPTSSGDNERGLLPNYNNPSDSIPISFKRPPRNEDDFDWKPKKSGSIRPMNTLDQPSPHTAFRNSYDSKHATTPSRTSQRRLSLSSGKILENLKFKVGDFGPERPAKRRRIGLHSSSSLQTHQSDVDKDVDLSNFGQPVACNGKPVPEYSATTKRLLRNPFAQNELRGVLSRVEMPKKRQRNKDRSGSIRSRTTASRTPSLIDATETEAGFESPSSARRKRARLELSPSSTPGIYEENHGQQHRGIVDLENATPGNEISGVVFPKKADAVPAKHDISLSSLRNDSDATHSKSGPLPTNSLMQMHDLPATSKIAGKEDSAQGSLSTTSSVVELPAQESQPPSAKPSDSKSDVGIHNGQDHGSADELEGANTISGARSLRSSPRKSNVSGRNSQAESVRKSFLIAPDQINRNGSLEERSTAKKLSRGHNGSTGRYRPVNHVSIPSNAKMLSEEDFFEPGEKRSTSPSDLKSTPFRGLRSSAEIPVKALGDSLIRPSRAIKRRSVGQQSSELLDCNSAYKQIAVKGIYSDLYMLSECALCWDAAEQLFYVTKANKQVYLRSTDHALSLGSQEIRRWTWSRTNGPTSVWIKGSITSNSNGSIVIEFVTRKGMVECYNKTREQLGSTEVLDPEQMLRLVDNQVRIVSKFWIGRGSSVYTRKDGTPLIEDGNGIVDKADDDDEDMIKYEMVPSNTRSEARRRVQQSDAEEQAVKSEFFLRTGDEKVISPYFSDRRRSTRQTRVRSVSEEPVITAPGWTVLNKPTPWRRPVTFPPQGKERVTVDFADLERLDEGNFLNDNLIAFALRQIQFRMKPEIRDKVHFFNSFFYSGLVSKGFDSVKRWTKNVDIFRQEYLIVPINSAFHWYVVIICNLPNLSRKAADSDIEDKPNEILDDEEACKANTDEVAAVVDVDEITNDQGGPLNAIDIDSQPAESGIRPSLGAGQRGKRRVIRGYDPDTTAIISLDSFGIPRGGDIRNLKDYLRAEAYDKRGMEIDVKSLQGMNAKGIPEQSNQSDCGVYLIGYIEEFAKNPYKFVSRVLTRQLDQHSDFASFDPAAKRAEIRNDLLKLADQTS